MRIDYIGNNNIYIQYDNGEAEEMKANIVDCFQTLCSWAKDGEKINFHIKNTNEEEINKLKKHIEKKINRQITDDDDNKYRIKIKTEYTARNIIEHIYHKHNKPSAYRVNNIIQEQTEEPITEEKETNVKEQIFQEDNNSSGFDMLRNLL